MAQKISYNDLQTILSTAKTAVANQTLPVIVSKQQLSYPEAVQVAMIETVVMYLNSKGLLKEVPLIDHKEK